MPPTMRWLIALVLGVVMSATAPAVTAQQSTPPPPAAQTTQGAKPQASPATLAELKPIINMGSNGQYPAAEAAGRELLSKVETSIGPESIDAAKVLDILTENMVFAGKARNPEVRALIDRSIAIKTRLLGPNDLDTLYSERNLATLLHKIGDYAGARPRFERVLEIQQKALGPDDAQIGFTSVNFGMLLRDMGDYAAAKESLARAIRIYEGLKRDTAVAIAASNMVGVLAGLNDYQGAKWYAERTLEIRQRIDGPDHLNTAYAQVNLAAMLALMLEHAAAKPRFESALVVMVKHLGEDHSAVADVVHNLAECLKTLGDADGARKYYARASAIYEKTMGPDHPGFADHLGGVAMFLGQIGDIPGALGLALRAERIGRAHTQLTVPGLPERQALALAAARVSSMDLLLTLATKRPTETEASRSEIWDALIRGRALILDEMAARQHVTAARGNADIAEHVRTLTLARQRLSTLFVRAAGYTPEQYRTLVDQARREKERAEEALAEKSAPIRADVGRSRIGLKEVVAALPADSALIAFVRSGHIELGEERTPGKPPRSFPSYFALVLRSGGATLTPVVLGRAQDVDRLVSRWREEMAQEAQAPGRASQRMEANYRVAATELRQKVWDPIAPQLEGVKRVFLVPDGSLHLLSFASLPVDQTSYLVEKGPVIHYLSAERDLVAFTTEPPNTGLLALGAPAFDDAPSSGAVPSGPAVFRGNRSACTSFESMQFGPLAESAREAQAIATLWEKTNGKPVSHLDGREATEAAFKRDAPGKRVLHLATHGFFLGGRCASATETRGQPGAAGPSRAGENPLLLSGLVLAGANRRATAGAADEDGILTAEEITALDLHGVEWAVLSACDTGLGEVMAGEGVFGLRRAFQVAGVRTIVMSLWQIQDQAARTWMTALYDGRFARRLDTATAAHQASMKVLTEQRAKKQSTHPFYWAGFVAAGDWR